MFVVNVSVSQCFLVQAFIHCNLSGGKELRSEHALSAFAEEKKKNVMILLEAAVGSLFSQ